MCFPMRFATWHGCELRWGLAIFALRFASVGVIRQNRQTAMLNDQRLSDVLLLPILLSALPLPQMHHDPALILHNKVLMLQACCALLVQDHDALMAAGVVMERLAAFNIHRLPVSLCPVIHLCQSCAVGESLHSK